MRRHAIERAGAAVAERTADLVDLIRVSIERVAHHQEDTCRPQAVDLRGYRLGRRLAKYDLIHLTEEYASRWRHLSLPTERAAILLASPRLTQECLDDKQEAADLQLSCDMDGIDIRCYLGKILILSVVDFTVSLEINHAPAIEGRSILCD